MQTVMRITMRFFALVFIICGLPVFLGLAAGLGVTASEGRISRPDQIEKFLLTYTCFGVSGLMSVAGAILWCLAKMAYPGAKSQPGTSN
jgi:hypothetical protein